MRISVEVLLSEYKTSVGVPTSAIKVVRESCYFNLVFGELFWSRLNIINANVSECPLHNGLKVRNQIGIKIVSLIIIFIV